VWKAGVRVDAWAFLFSVLFCYDDGLDFQLGKKKPCISNAAKFMQKLRPLIVGI
jgi:hypothetical protein